MEQQRMPRLRTDIVEQFVVYKHPRDFPDQFVLRRWWISGPDPEATNDYRLADTLAGVRELVPWDCVCLHRYPEDDPTIVEVWI